MIWGKKDRATAPVAAGWGCVLIIIALCAVTIDGRTDTRPNFIIFDVDDMGYGDLSSFGHPTIHTPNLDRMVAEGMKLTQMYAGAATCTPSRAALQTARYPIRSGFANSKIPVIIDPSQPSGIPYNETTIGETLQDAGYKTALFGKWHLGINRYKNGDGLSLPMYHGYDYFYGFPVSNNHECDPRSPGPISCILMRQNTILEQPTDMYKLTQRMTDEAIKYIGTHRDDPFFFIFNFVKVHTALFASPAFQNTSLRGPYGDDVAEVDFTVGRILEYLRQIGIDRNTLVIFTSDNGAYAEEKFDGGSSGLFRGNKAQTWEGGFRVPGVAWWPGTIRPHTFSPAVVSHMDFYPTFARLAKASMPSDRAIDGLDFSEVLLKTCAQKYVPSQRNTLFYYCGTQINAVRLGPYKVHFATQPFIDEATQSCPFDFYIGGGGCSCLESQLEFHDPPLLYHLEYDPGERIPLKPETFDDYWLIVRAAVAEVEAHIATVETVEDQLMKKPSPRLQPCCNPPKCRCGDVDPRPYGWRVVQKLVGAAGGTAFSGDTYIDYLSGYMAMAGDAGADGAAGAGAGAGGGKDVASIRAKLAAKNEPQPIKYAARPAFRPATRDVSY